MNGGSGNEKLGVAMMLLSTLFYGVAPVLVRMSFGEGLDPEGLLVLRFLVGFPLLLATMLALGDVRDLRVGRDEAALVVFASVAGLGLSMLLFFHATRLIGASLSIMLSFVYPSMTALLAKLFLGEEITSRKKKSLAVSFAGVVMVVLPLADGGTHGIEGFDPVLGGAYAIGCAFFWAVTQVSFQKILETRPPLATSTLTSGIMLLFFMAVNGVAYEGITARGWWIVVLLGSVCWYVPYLLSMYSLKIIGASRAAILQCTQPAITVAVASMTIGEEFVSVQYAGMLMIIYAVYLVSGGEKAFGGDTRLVEEKA